MDIITGIIDREGGYVNHSHDRGGATCWGITEVVARENGYMGDMRAMPRSFAESVYTKRYIVTPGFDKVLAISSLIGEEMIDTGVNMGVSHPGPWLQRILNALNQQQRTFPDLVVDGQLGAATLGALKTVIRQRGRDGEIVIARALNCQQGARYLDITENREQNESFFYGWMLNRVGLA